MEKSGLIRINGFDPVGKYAEVFGGRLVAFHAKGNLVSEIENENENHRACAENVLVRLKGILVFVIKKSGNQRSQSGVEAHRKRGFIYYMEMEG